MPRQSMCTLTVHMMHGAVIRRTSNNFSDCCCAARAATSIPGRTTVSMTAASPWCENGLDAHYRCGPTGA